MPPSSSSSCSAYTGPWKYDVFLSFRGEIRNEFMSHLYSALRRNQIKTFIDEKLDKGKDLQVLLQAIEESAISIIIFSKGFAGSTWCLDEVMKIVECMKCLGQIVMPVFLQVDPDSVTSEDGSFAVAIAKHEEVATARNDHETLKKVPKWKEALVVAACQSGWDSKVTRPEAKLIEEIVKDIEKKQIKMSQNSPSKNLVGVNSRIQLVISLLCIGSDDVNIVGIWGMGGIGKTTIANALFEQFSSQFEACCFLENVKEKTQKFGVDHVMKGLYSRILDEDDVSFSLQNNFVRARLRRTKVLIVLEDVGSSLDLKKLLLEGHESFGRGSKIIVTSRDLQVIKNVADDTYNVEQLNDEESLHLFSLHAFKRNEPPANRHQQSLMVLDYCKGNPLALLVLGSALFGKDERFWESTLSGLGEDANPEIHHVLRVSYESLSNEQQKIFLDIACYFRGRDRDYVTEILDGCYSSTYSKICTLVDKALITISSNVLEMHDLLQEMGRNIVREESNQPEKRSRLWNIEETYNVLRKKKGTDAIEGLSLEGYKRQGTQLEPDAFIGMDNLKLLIVSKHDVNFNRTRLSPFLPDALRYLHWFAFPFETLPLDFNAENLVMLVLCCGRYEKLWSGVQHLPRLKRLELQGSHFLTEIPNLSEAKNIRYINLEGCRRILEIPSYFEHLNKLEELILAGCIRLGKIPSRFNSEALRFLNLEGCRNVKLCPKIFGRLESLYLSRTAIVELPQFISKLESLKVLKLANCSSLSKTPHLPPNVKEFHLSEAVIEELPQSISEQKFLKIINLDYLIFKKLLELTELPPCIEELYVRGAPERKKVHSLIAIILGLFWLFWCKVLSRFAFKTGNCSKLSSFPSSIGRMNSLRKLKFYYCLDLEIFPDILEPMEHLTSLTIESCRNLRRLPSDIYYLRHLETLDITEAAIQELPSSIEELRCLKFLSLQSCKELVTLPNGIHKLSNCSEIFIGSCKKLRYLPELPPSLETLTATGCTSIKTLSTSSKCSFTFMSFGDCFQLDEDTRRFIAIDAQRRIEFMAAKIPKDRRSIQLFFPGDEIPEWFSDQSAGSSVAIKLPSDRHQLKGMAFSIIVASKPEAIKPVIMGAIIFECHVKSNNQNNNDLVFHWQTPIFLPLAELDQVVMHYIPSFEEVFSGCSKEEIWRSKYSGNEVSFQFSSSGSYYIKKCAVLLP